MSAQEERRAAAREQEAPDPGQESEGASPLERVQAQLEQESESESESESEIEIEIEHPAKLLRIAHTVRSLLDEVKTTELDEAGRRRLADIHERVMKSLHEIVSEDLSAELEGITAGATDDDVPSAAELRIAQAQLAGWLEGLFRGIQASMASQQRLLQQQLQQMQDQGPPREQTTGGQYL
ncbi:MAG: proteasome activator [Nitriliruptorales bacterium]